MESYDWNWGPINDPDILVGSGCDLREDLCSGDEDSMLRFV